MVSKLIVSICTIYYCFGCLLMVVNARSTKYKELKPVLIKSVVSHPRISYNNLDTSSPSSSQSSQEQEEGLTSRKIYQFPGTDFSIRHDILFCILWLYRESFFFRTWTSSQYPWATTTSPTTTRSGTGTNSSPTKIWEKKYSNVIGIVTVQLSKSE